mmetsp:Transcript_44341/g.49733  ORF Transcript_44341/g.49733 Transcript_44341/m.49733 type:complete len:130 (+) Transcript_44341:430-819(+)
MASRVIRFSWCLRTEIHPKNGTVPIKESWRKPSRNLVAEDEERKEEKAARKKEENDFLGKDEEKDNGDDDDDDSSNDDYSLEKMMISFSESSLVSTVDLDDSDSNNDSDSNSNKDSNHDTENRSQQINQ